MCCGKMEGILMASISRATHRDQREVRFLANPKLPRYFTDNYSTVCAFAAQLPYSNYSRHLKFRMGFLSCLLSCAIAAQPLFNVAFPRTIDSNS